MPLSPGESARCTRNLTQLMAAKAGWKFDNLRRKECLSRPAGPKPRQSPGDALARRHSAVKVVERITKVFITVLGPSFLRKVASFSGRKRSSLLIKNIAQVSRFFFATSGIKELFGPEAKKKSVLKSYLFPETISYVVIFSPTFGLG